MQQLRRVLESEKQVCVEHYDFSRYVDKRRWASMWHQLDELLALNPESVLEIGPGPGVFKAVGASLGLNIETLDVDSELKPDHVGSCLALPFSDNTYDVVCAFQMLEHLPYKKALSAFKELVRVAKLNILISVPDARRAWPYSLHIPKIGDVKFYLIRPALWPRIHRFDGEHYWELNKKGYALKKVIKDLTACPGVFLRKSYRVKENPYHHFLLFGVTSS